MSAQRMSAERSRERGLDASMADLAEGKRGSPPAEQREPLVACDRCGKGWYGARMAEGLLLLGSCPRCAGPLRFTGLPASPVEESELSRSVAPHMVLGLPRPSRRTPR